MNSRITIDVNQDNQPIIKIEYRESNDVRDKLVKRFLDGFGTDSNWARFEFSEYLPGVGHNAVITPISKVTLEEEAKTMQAWVKYTSET